MNIHFGYYFDQTYDFNYGEQINTTDIVLGPIGLLNWLKLNLGLNRTAISDEIRISAYSTAIENVIAKKHPFFESYSKNPLAFAEKLLLVRDELALYGALSNDNVKGERINFIKEIENHFTIKGISDDFINALEKIDTLTNTNINILVYDKIDLLPRYLKKLLDELKANGVIINEIKAETKTENTDLIKLIGLINGEKNIEFTGDGTVIVCEFSTDEEAYENLYPLTQTTDAVHIMQTETIGLESKILVNKGAPFGQSHSIINSYWINLPYLITGILSEKLDVKKVYQLSKTQYSIFGEDTAEFIEKRLESVLAFDKENWLIELPKWEEKERAKEKADIDDINNRKNDIQKGIDYWIFDRAPLFNKDEIAEVKSVIAFYEKALKIINNFGVKHFNAVGYNNCKISFSSLIYHLKKIENQTISFTQLENLCVQYQKPTTLEFTTPLVGSSNIVNAAGNNLHKNDLLVWWNFTDTIFPTFEDHLFESEKTSLKEAGIQINTVENHTSLWMNSIVRSLSNTKKIIFVVPQYIRGEHQGCNVLLNQLRNLKTFSKIEKNNIEEILTTVSINSIKSNQTKLPDTIGEVKPEKYWQVGEMKDLEMKDKESYTSLIELIDYPHAYFLKNIMEIYKKGVPDFDALFRTKGTVSHKTIELLVIDNKFLNATKEDIKTATEKAIELCGAILNLKENIADRKEVESCLLASIPVLANAIKNSAIKTPLFKMEEKLEKQNFCTAFNKLTGNADMVIYDGNNPTPIAVIDLKYSGSKKRKTEMKEGRDYQLAIYARLLNDKITRAFYIIDDMNLYSNNHALFPNSIYINTEKTENQIQQLITSFQFRKQEFEEGKIEVGIGTLIVDLAFWLNPNIVKVNVDWDKKTKQQNKYENFINFIK